MNRRTFLGAAAAALSLSGEAAADDPPVDVTENPEYGTGVAHIQRTTEAFAALELFEEVDDSAELGTKGHWGDGVDPHVEVNISTEQARLTVALPPGEARAFAAELRTAATHAEQGAARARGEVEE